MTDAVKDTAAIMAKALKTSEPTMFLGSEIIMKKITYADSFIIDAIVNDIFREASASGLEGAILNQVLVTTQVMANVKMFAYKLDGTPVYRTMEDISNSAKVIETFTAINDLFVLYMKEMELTKAEKKS